MSPKVFAIIAGIIMAGVGLALGLMPVNGTSIGGQSVPCGNGFSVGISDEQVHDDAVDSLARTMGVRSSGSNAQTCALAALDNNRDVFAWSLIGVGLFVTIGGLVVRTRPRQVST